MKYLLDTHAVIWYLGDSPKLSEKVAEIIDNSENIIYISSVSFWEIVIKMSIGKLDLDFTLDDLFLAIKNNNFEILQIEDEYLHELSVLPFIHRDPFDSLLIATANAEKASILTADENIQKYDVEWIW